jgi:hypothetical protein
MARTTSFTKRSLINKANSSIVIATTAAAFVLIFTVIAGKSLVSQMSYQNRVISAKKDALAQLQADLAARDSLQKSYTAFVAEDPNVLGGGIDGTGPNDGDNAKIILDALPSKYDFPALATSLEKMINDQGLKITGITGIDEEAIQSAQQASPTPKPIIMPFQVQVGGSYPSVQGLIDVMLRSIRPFQIQTMEFSGDEGNMNATIAAQTFFQPEKNLKIRTEVIK